MKVSLTLQPQERQALRRARLRVAELAGLSPEELLHISAGDITPERAEELVACARLQRLPGIGASLASDLYDIGVTGPDDLDSRTADDLYVAVSRRQGGVGLDPCVHDAFAAAVYAASTTQPEPELLLWWNWSARRKVAAFDPRELMESEFKQDEGNFKQHPEGT